MPSFLLTVILSYLLGSIPFGYLLVRFFHGEDIRQSGSGNIGATNVSRKSPALGLLTLLLDALKGSAAVAVGMLLSPPAVLGMTFSHVPWYRNLSPPTDPLAATWAAAAALFAVVGHMFPVWLKFRGGKGVATGLGSFVLISPHVVLIAAGIYLVLVLLFRYSSLGSISAAAALPILSWMMHDYGRSAIALSLMSFTCLLIIVKHHENIHRLLAGTENRLGAKRA